MNFERVSLEREEDLEALRQFPGRVLRRGLGCIRKVKFVIYYQSAYSYKKQLRLLRKVGKIKEP
jgi:hypothetical protein